MAEVLGELDRVIVAVAVVFGMGVRLGWDLRGMRDRHRGRSDPPSRK